jgi:hypothetical protein
MTRIVAYLRVRSVRALRSLSRAPQQMQRLSMVKGRIVAGIANRPCGRPFQFEDLEGFVAHATGAADDAP